MTACLNRTIQIVFVSQYSLVPKVLLYLSFLQTGMYHQQMREIFASVQFARSFTCNKYRRGHNIDPCGSPHSIFGTLICNFQIEHIAIYLPNNLLSKFSFTPNSIMSQLSYQNIMIYHVKRLR